ncbi:MAG: hypothetical protein WC823_01360 [Parcubacteria group bacterium]
MNAKQSDKLLGILTEHRTEFLGLSTEDAQWVIQSPKDAITLFLEAIKSRKTPNIIEFIGTITVPARTERFVARDHFIVDMSKKAKVKISYLGDNFSNNFLGKIEEPIAESTLRYGKLLRRSVDKPIINDLGGEANAETTLSEMFGCMELQPTGKKGALLTNGYANIFYIRDDKGVLWAVLCSWLDAGWCVDAGSVEGADEWGGGSQVFSRNP